MANAVGSRANSICHAPGSAAAGEDVRATMPVATNPDGSASRKVRNGRTGRPVLSKEHTPKR